MNGMKDCLTVINLTVAIFSSFLLFVFVLHPSFAVASSEIPSPPRNLEIVDVGETNIVLEWDAPTGGSVTGYGIYRGLMEAIS